MEKKNDKNKKKNQCGGMVKDVADLAFLPEIKHDRVYKLITIIYVIPQKEQKIYSDCMEHRLRTNYCQHDSALLPLPICLTLRI